MGLMLCPQISTSADDLAYNLEFTGTIVAQNLRHQIFPVSVKVLI